MTTRRVVVALLLFVLAGMGCVVHTDHVFVNETVTYTPQRAGLELRQFAPIEDAPGQWTGTWSMARPAKDADHLIIRQRIAKGSYHDRWISLSEISDFPGHDAEGAVSFAIERDAATMRFEGAFSGKNGSGVATFTPSNAFASSIRELFDTELEGKQTLELFWSDLEIGYVAEVKALRPAVTLDEVHQLRRSGVTIEYIREVADAGYDYSLAELSTLRRSGVTASYAAEMREAGLTLKSDDLVRARNHGLSAEYAREFRDGGFDLSLDELVRVRSSGMLADYAAAIRAAHSELSVDQIIRLKNSGVPKEYPAELQAAGYALSPEEIIRVRNSGVSTAYIMALSQAGYEFSIEDIIRLRNSGVSDEYAAAIVVEGRDNLGVKEIIDLRNRGVSAETVRKLRQ